MVRIYACCIVTLMYFFQQRAGLGKKLEKFMRKKEKAISENKVGDRYA